MSRLVIRACDCDDYEDDEGPYYEIGSAYEMGGPAYRPKLKSVSDAAHRAMTPRSVGRTSPVGFRVPGR